MTLGLSRRLGRTLLSHIGETVIEQLVFTTTKTGNSSDSTVWDQGKVPDYGDTIIVATGHTLTIDQDLTIGYDPDPVADVITCQGTGALTIGEGVTLTVTGNITMASGAFTMAAGSSLVGDIATGLVAGVHSNVYGAEGAILDINGTSGSRSSVSSIGAGTFYLDWYQSGANSADVANLSSEYCDFEDLGDAATRAIYWRRQGISFAHCTFDGCAYVGTPGYHYADLNIIVSDCNFINGIDTYDLQLSNNSATAITGTRTISGCAFNNGLNLAYNHSTTSISDCYVNNLSTSALVAEYPTDITRCFIDKNSDFVVYVNEITDCFRYVPSTDNAHLFLLNDNESGWTFNGVLFEHGDDWTTDECDGILNNANMAASRNVVVQNCIVLPNNAGRASCTIATDNCAYSNVIWTLNKNTYFSDNKGFFLVAAHGTGSAGRIASCQSNLAYCEDATPTEAHIMQEVGDYTPADDYCTVADYNGYDYVNAPAYDVTADGFASTPGTHDLNEGANLVASGRDLASWAAYALGATGTDAQKRTAAVNAFKAMNDPASPYYDADATVSNLVTWIKAGFAPQNANYADSGHDAGRIGAVDVAA